MTDAALILRRGELCSWEWPEQDVLIVTDDVHNGHTALAIPFREATVIEVESDDPTDLANKVDVARQFDTAVIDRSSFELSWLATATRELLPALRPDGRVLVMFESGPGHGGAKVSAPAFAGLCWDGIGTLNGQACAILRATDGPVEAHVALGEMLALANAAAGLTSVPDVGPADAQARQALEDCRRSEHALLEQLDALLRQLEVERHERRGLRLVRTVFRRSRLGRTVLGMFRPMRLAAGVVRRRFGGRAPE